MRLALRCWDSKCRALENCYIIRILYRFLESICRGDCNLSLCTTLFLAKTMPLRTVYIRQLRYGIVFPRDKVGHRLRSQSAVQSESRNLQQICMIHYIPIVSHALADPLFCALADRSDLPVLLIKADKK